MKVGDMMGQVVDPGVYLLSLVAVNGNDVSSRTGDRMITTQWSEKESDARIWERLAVSDKAAWKMAQLWCALGGSEEYEVNDLDEFADKLCAKINEAGEVYATLKVDEYNGKKSNKVVEYRTKKEGELLSSPDSDSPF